MNITRELRPALSLVALFTLFTGLLFPAAFTGIMQLALPYQANGSMLTQNGQVVGSALIGQNFSAAKYFAPRPSALDKPYDAGVSGASNLGPASAQLLTNVKANIATYLKAYGAGPVPADAVTASGSGLDPDISLANALRQAPAIATARNLPASTVTDLVGKETHHSFLGIIGTDHLNVLELNVALDQLPAK
jgi:potassium-transporting ATPase KdpC subunit